MPIGMSDEDDQRQISVTILARLDADIRMFTTIDIN